MKTKSKKQKYFLYRYVPSSPSYFDQTDIITLGPGKANNDLDEFYNQACTKNSCTEDEIEVIEVFEDKRLLNHFLKKNNDAYLIYSYT